MSAAGSVASTQDVSSPLCVKRVEAVFSRCFLARANTRLSGGYAEPLYLPAEKTGQMNVLRYREDFFASALHEVAHWCIAGSTRRLQTDFGYWYAPDGRNVAQQQAFENVEYKPQALEWFFARACGHNFRISADNLDGSAAGQGLNDAFELRVLVQAKHWCRVGLPPDGSLFFRALCREFGAEGSLNCLEFSLSSLK
ncbi:MAG: elongation factor P hydroxylase [Proteobacteria bacterium]|nr:elongation factor P hydroxylase [Pseudomonadota bacterium]